MSNKESILAQEQSVLHKSGVGRETQGTLVLTEKRLMFVAANSEDVFSLDFDRLRYADVEDLDSVTQSEANLSLSLDSIVSSKGNRGVMTNPNLKVKYQSQSGEREAEFVQTIIGGRKKNLNDWARVIDGLKSGQIKAKIPTWIPEKDTLESRIVDSLCDLQEKGAFEIESEIEKKYKVDLDPDDVEKACDNLVSKGVIEKKNEGFFRLISPLGSDDLSN